MAEIRYRTLPADIVELSGKSRVEFLQGMCTNDVAALPEGGAAPAATLSPRGKILFCYRVVRLSDRLLLLPDAPGIGERLADHLRRHAIFADVRVDARPGELALVEFFGAPPPSPPAGALAALPARGEVSGGWLLPGAAPPDSRTLPAPSRAVSAEEALVLRVEAGRAAFGVDFGEDFLTEEANLEPAISRSKGCYVGQEVVARLKTYGRVNRRVRRLAFPEGEVPGVPAPLAFPDDPEKEAGLVTSAVVSPSLGAIGLGVVRREAEEGSVLIVRGHPERRARVGAAATS